MVPNYTVFLSRFQPGRVQRQQVYRTLVQLHTIMTRDDCVSLATSLDIDVYCSVSPSLFSQGTEPGLNPSQVTINISHMHMHFYVSVQCLNPSQSTSTNCKQNDSAMIFFPHCCSSVCLTPGVCNLYCMHLCRTPTIVNLFFYIPMCICIYINT